MNNRPVTDWERYALIAHVVRVLGADHPLGRKAVHKIVYLLQELVGLPLRIPYTFYTYGVYSFELASTLGVVENMNGIMATYDPALRAYDLSPGERCESLERKGKAFLDEYRDSIDRVCDLALGKTGKALELISTIIYVAKNEHLRGIPHEAKLLERVADLKPQFSSHQIEQQVSQLRERGLLGRS